MCLTVAKAIKCLSIDKAIQCQARCQAVTLWKWYEGRIRHYNKVRSLTTVHLINSGALCLILLPTCQSTSLLIRPTCRPPLFLASFSFEKHAVFRVFLFLKERMHRL